MGARYSKQAGYTVTRRAPVRRKTVRTVQRGVKFGPTTAKYFGLAVLGILAIVMLTQSSTNATNAYKQNEIKKEISHIDQDVERLKLEAKRAESLQTIQQSALKDQMEPVKQVEPVEKGEIAGASTEKPRP